MENVLLSLTRLFIKKYSHIGIEASGQNKTWPICIVAILKRMMNFFFFWGIYVQKISRALRLLRGLISIYF